ncbi:hypothetical protein [Pelagicoccus sp. SDUM812002]|uniref:hypothetical protein n=1 Tax=Pelagicoccus sp. SDUM812002 TaxID=3041266 RepID=UPI00280CE4B1|nr:hypothetical protein [Pelagicoccus sp. SDUM812002]MDQ8187483.1 hypothetical protein [Pelagicoccus sp. SDUM812002]
MARPAAKKLTVPYIAANTCLLVPLRGDFAIAAIGFVLLASLAEFDRKDLSNLSALRTWDGRAMRSLLFVPFGLLLLRSVLLYEASNLLVGLFCSSIATLFFFGHKRRAQIDLAVFLEGLPLVRAEELQTFLLWQPVRNR